MKVLSIVKNWFMRCDGIKVANWCVYLWLAIFLAMPLLWVVILGFAKSSFDLLPYYSVILWEGWYPYLNVTLDNFYQLWITPMYFNIFWNSFTMAVFVTFFLIPIAYAIAYSVHKLPCCLRYVVLFIVVMPCFISSLVRNYTLIFVLGKNGILNVLLMQFSVISEPLDILYTKWAVLIGVFYTYLPLMLVPIYANLEKIDDSLVDAANILGCSPVKAFWLVTFRLSIYGVFTGCLLIFVSVMGEMLIPQLLGGGEVVMLGSAIWDVFFVARDWPSAAAITTLMLVMLFGAILIMRKIQGKYVNV